MTTPRRCDHNTSSSTTHTTTLTGDCTIVEICDGCEAIIDTRRHLHGGEATWDQEDHK